MNSDRLMRNMIQSMGMGMGMPNFGAGIFDDFMFGHPGGSRTNHMSGGDPFSAMMPQGFMNPMSMMMMDPFQSFQQSMSLANNGSSNNGAVSYCSSSTTTYTFDKQGKPQVYHSSNEIKQGPNGLKETKSSVRDSRTGHQELAIGHHLRDKAHIKKKSKNAYTGEEEQTEDLVNLDESEAEAFEQTWLQQARNVSSLNQLAYGDVTQGGAPSRKNRLALTNGSPRDDCTHSPSTSNKHSLNLASKLFKKDKKRKRSKDERHK